MTGVGGLLGAAKARAEADPLRGMTKRKARAKARKATAKANAGVLRCAQDDRRWWTAGSGKKQEQKADPLRG
jgi:hypothetical protein